MQSTTHLKHFLSILMLFGFILLIGGCSMKQRGVVYGGPISHLSGDGSGSGMDEQTVGKRMARALKKVIPRIGPEKAGSRPQCCCGQIYNECEKLKNVYKNQLFSSLDKYMQALTEQEKDAMSSFILRFPCVVITELQSAGIQLREVLEGLSVELGIDAKKIRRLVMEEHGHIPDTCEELKNSYKDQLSCSLDKDMQALTEQEKKAMLNLIVRFPCVAITELKRAGIQPEEVLEGLSLELGIDAKKLGGW